MIFEICQQLFLIRSRVSSLAFTYSGNSLRTAAVSFVVLRYAHENGSDVPHGYPAGTTKCAVSKFLRPSA